MDASTFATIAGGVGGALVTGLTVGAAIARPIRKLGRQQDEFREDWYGLPARPGRTAQPGVMERLGGIEGQLHPNGGGSLRDAVNRLDTKLVGLETRFDDHIKSQAHTS